MRGMKRPTPPRLGLQAGPGSGRDGLERYISSAIEPFRGAARLLGRPALFRPGQGDETKRPPDETIFGLWPTSAKNSGNAGFVSRRQITRANKAR
jgi:hypothetical protein